MCLFECLELKITCARNKNLIPSSASAATAAAATTTTIEDDDDDDDDDDENRVKKEYKRIEKITHSESIYKGICSISISSSSSRSRKLEFET